MVRLICVAALERNWLVVFFFVPGVVACGVTLLLPIYLPGGGMSKLNRKTN